MIRLGLILLCLASSIGALGSTRTDKAIEEVVAVGIQPGPKMWRVNKDDRELWIFATLSPIPKNLQWDAASVEAILTEADEVIYAPGVSISANPFKGIFALPLLWGIQNNPDKRKLEDILPDELYTRWSALKATYIGKNKKIEKRRPIFAANELFNEAIDKSGLEPSTKVLKTIKKLVKKYKVPTTDTTISRKIENPRAVLKEFKKSSIDDITCFRKTIERLEIDLAAMSARALAWSTGDIAALRALPHEDQGKSCIDAVMNSQFGSELASAEGLTNFQQDTQNIWIQAAEAALKKNEVTFAMLPISSVLKPDGPLAYFQDKGYRVKGGGL